MKKSVRTILFLIIFASIGTFIACKFDLLEKIINKDSVNGKMPITIYVDKPKVKIIDVNSNSRPIAVSINNNHAAWPQAGLQDAYLSYELIAEGGITRILAFFKERISLFFIRSYLFFEFFLSVSERISIAVDICHENALASALRIAFEIYFCNSKSISDVRISGKIFFKYKSCCTFKAQSK